MPSDTTRKGLSVVRREEENNAITENNNASGHQANAALPGNNDAADRAEEHSANANNLESVGATDGYEKKK
ncbi:hypothetical protein P171DRAFT_430206 [Karstenula rhodostoma CBS 690.94]|uniref:Uncharacterized protein n=1 Tax=Karstenula rhodostoma CBS 690.94 TaxID=1392251 RepID=A0A9P4PQA7_9PLEO|nr:hypothetical protein P171DRAFT_430206 [Karstenula rhodostoma CBS 690.94]